MASSTRQYGRRGASNVTNATNTTSATIASSDSGVALSPSSTASTSTPPRRYVLDVPIGRTTRTSHTSSSTNGVVDESDETNTQSRSGDGGTITYSSVLNTDIHNDNDEQLSRSGSREYYYRDGANESSSTVTRYVEGSTYANTALEDQEVQELTAQATPDVKNYPINVDNNPELIVRPNTQRLTYTQDIAVRYLQPSTPPPPGVRFLIKL
jgi:hypothetical protein